MGFFCEISGNLFAKSVGTWNKSSCRS
ncbi:hypothetical protein HVY81_09300 [Escherichia coli]|nr:hypothetical protein HVY80_03645 [Escherichia coli]QMF60253.1 hypothetical protein HVY79_03640 [Escherichia coli]QMF65104.1 hypothetical protein HVY78_03635 [Escherichia coli]QMR97971.1 hypothetical protein HVY81_09300 [Escherichia coli]